MAITYHQIEHDIPLPKSPRYGKWSITAEKMKVGDSVLCKNYTEANALRVRIRDQGFKGLSRKLPEGVRVWKVKK